MQQRDRHVPPALACAVMDPDVSASHDRGSAPDDDTHMASATSVHDEEEEQLRVYPCATVGYRLAHPPAPVLSRELCCANDAPSVPMVLHDPRRWTPGQITECTVRAQGFAHECTEFDILMLMLGGYRRSIHIHVRWSRSMYHMTTTRGTDSVMHLYFSRALRLHDTALHAWVLHRLSEAGGSRSGPHRLRIVFTGSQRLLAIHALA